MILLVLLVLYAGVADASIHSTQNIPELCPDFQVVRTVAPSQPEYQILVHGSDDSRQSLAKVPLDSPGIDFQGLINGGYFSFQAPLSYSKGIWGYESRSPVVKGPRACFVERKDGRREITLSKGLVGGQSLHEEDKNVLCAGPTLLRDGENVVEDAFINENFQTSGIGKDSRLPRSGLCIDAEQNLHLITAQSATRRSCGFSLSAFAEYMKSISCIDGMNLDGGGSSAIWQRRPGTDLHYYGYEQRSIFQFIGIIKK